MKRFLLITALGLSLCNAYALTPVERKNLLRVRALVEQGMEENRTAKQLLLESDARANAAEQTAATEAGQLAQAAFEAKAAHDRELALKKDNDKMAPVYKECTSYWGLGAIGYGFKDLIKHMLILTIVIAVLGISIWILSIAVPVTAPFIMIGLRAVGGVFKLTGKGIAVIFGELHVLLQRLLAKKPAPPAPQGS